MKATERNISISGTNAHIAESLSGGSLGVLVLQIDTCKNNKFKSVDKVLYQLAVDFPLLWRALPDSGESPMGAFLTLCIHQRISYTYRDCQEGMCNTPLLARMSMSSSYAEVILYGPESRSAVRRTADHPAANLPVRKKQKKAAIRT
jgi:hypothetical protein